MDLLPTADNQIPPIKRNVRGQSWKTNEEKEAIQNTEILLSMNKNFILCYVSSLTCTIARTVTEPADTVGEHSLEGQMGDRRQTER